MAEGGFVVKFDDQVIARCFAVSFDYDAWQYTLNEKETKDLPPDLSSITVQIER